MFKTKAAIVAFVLALSTLAVPSAPVPRQAPELSFIDPSGKAISLASFKGKVVALEFLFVRSTHCVRVAQLLNQLNDELRARGFQAVGVAFSAPHSAADADAATVTQFVEAYRLAFPVGYIDKTDVDRFLNRSKDDVLSIPQVVIIDRAGMIRAQSGHGDPKLEDGASLRTLLDSLLKEAPPTKKAPAKTASLSRTGMPEQPQRSSLKEFDVLGAQRRSPRPCHPEVRDQRTEGSMQVINAAQSGPPAGAVLVFAPDGVRQALEPARSAAPIWTAGAAITRGARSIIYHVVGNNPG